MLSSFPFTAPLLFECGKPGTSRTPCRIVSIISSICARSCNLNLEHVHESCKESRGRHAPRQSLRALLLRASPWLRYWFVECARLSEAMLRPKSWELLHLHRSGPQALSLYHTFLKGSECVGLRGQTDSSFLTPTPCFAAQDAYSMS